MNTFGRDIIVTDIIGEHKLITACDSCGAIGEKELDRLLVPSELVGELTARVSIMEVCAVGGAPKVIAVTIANESVPTGDHIIKGVRRELRVFGLSDLEMIISTEKNMATCQTGIGISVSGICHTSDLKLGQSVAGDLLYCLGTPLVGEEVAGAPKSNLADTRDIRALIYRSTIHDIIPVGSGGLASEIETLERHLNLRFQSSVGLSIDLKKSAGPATCLLFSSSTEISYQTVNGKPVTEIGRFLV